MQTAPTVGPIYPDLNRMLTGRQFSLPGARLEARHNAHCGGKRVSDEQRGVLVKEELAKKMLESDGISGASILAPTNLKLMATLHA